METLMTYTDWQREYTRKANLKHKIRKQKAKQKLLATLLIIISITIPLLLDGDCTISLITFPLGIYMMFTRENLFRERRI